MPESIQIHRKKRNRGSKNQIFDDIEAEIAILWPKSEKFVTGFDFFGSKYLMNDKISFRVANNYEIQYSKLSGIVFKYVLEYSMLKQKFFSALNANKVFPKA